MTELQTTEELVRSGGPSAGGTPERAGPGRPTPELPDTPLVTLRPSQGWVALNLRNLWRYRDLLWLLTRRDIQVRYRQTILGAAWAVLQPLVTMAIFWVIFGRLAGIPSDGIPYPLFALAALVPWTFFSNAVTNSSNSLVGNASLISKVYFPRVLIPIAGVLAGLVDLTVAAAVVGVLMLAYGIGFGWGLLLVPPLVLLTTTLAVAVGMWLSALNVKYRDVRYAIPFVMQVWMYTSPIIYPASLVPEQWAWLLALNPFTGLIQGYRSALFGHPVDWLSLGFTAGITALLLVWSACVFRRMERGLADVI